MCWAHFYQAPEKGVKSQPVAVQNEISVLVFSSLFVKISVWRRQSYIVRDGASSHEIYYVFQTDRPTDRRTQTMTKDRQCQMGTPVEASPSGMA